MNSFDRFWVQPNQVHRKINDKHPYILMGKIRNALNQIHANLLQSHFSSNIVHAKYDTFTLLVLSLHAF